MFQRNHKRMPRIFIFISLALSACTPAQQVIKPVTSPLQVAPQARATSQLSIAQKEKIGHKIWQNESGGKIEGLTVWNQGEEFPSLGVGHFIWYPKGFQGRWTESFPQFIAYARSRGQRNIPAWIGNARVCPWNTRAEFERDFHGARLRELRTFLSRTVTLQTDFIIQRSHGALPSILAAAPSHRRQAIEKNFHNLSAAPSGAYALIDYVNFKGEGTNPEERYKGQGWGLLQVLDAMRPVPAGQAAAREFAQAAKRVLDRRITNSPAARGESRWRTGWHNRADTYARAL